MAEEVGFDKIWRKLAQVEDLRTVILDGLRVAEAKSDSEESIATSCPKIQHLDLSKNLFATIAPVVDICAELRGLRRLSIKYARREVKAIFPRVFAPITLAFTNIGWVLCVFFCLVEIDSHTSCEMPRWIGCGMLSLMLSSCRCRKRC